MQLLLTTFLISLTASGLTLGCAPTPTAALTATGVDGLADITQWDPQHIVASVGQSLKSKTYQATMHAIAGTSFSTYEAALGGKDSTGAALDAAYGSIGKALGKANITAGVLTLNEAVTAVATVKAIKAGSFKELSYQHYASLFHVLTFVQHPAVKPSAALALDDTQTAADCKSKYPEIMWSAVCVAVPAGITIAKPGQNSNLPYSQGGYGHEAPSPPTPAPSSTPAGCTQGVADADRLSTCARSCMILACDK